MIATHPRCFGREQDVLDPLHYLSLLEQRPGAFGNGEPLRRWRKHWPEDYNLLLEELRNRLSDGRGVKSSIAVLKLHREYPAEQVEQAVHGALEWALPAWMGCYCVCVNYRTHSRNWPRWTLMVSQTWLVLVISR